MLADCDDDAKLRLDIPLLAHTYDCESVTYQAKHGQADELVLGGYVD